MRHTDPRHDGTPAEGLVQSGALDGPSAGPGEDERVEFVRGVALDVLGQDKSYHNVGSNSDSTVPRTVKSISASGGFCIHGAIYHTEIESSAYYRNWASDIQNSTTRTLC